MDSKAYLNMDLLRFTTAGSVDDGKSTLIGRLLYDSKSIFEDQMEAIERASEKKKENKALPLTWRTGILQLRKGNLLLPILRATFSIPEI
jgi:sulfate adenylyltransferase subunit 1